MRRLPRPLLASIPHQPTSRRAPLLLPLYLAQWRAQAASRDRERCASFSVSRRSSSAPESAAKAEDDAGAASPDALAGFPKLPYKFETGLALFAKRTPRPFPPPFLSPPSGSFSDPLSTHNRSRDRRAFVNGELIKGWTNGDDAVFASDYFIGANDGVGAWSARPRGHAG